MSRTLGKRLFILVLVGALLSAGVYMSPGFFAKPEKPTDASAELKVGGSSVVFFVMDKWKASYRKEKGIDIDYHSEGSTEGIKRMIDSKFQVGFTSAPVTDEQKKQAKAKGQTVVQIPVLLSAVVPIYNVKELKGKEGKDKQAKDEEPLKFTAEVLAQIFLGKITQWNDPAIQLLNKGVKLPDTKITVVHREDSSGTTFIFTDYLQGASETWQKEIGKAQNLVKWPVGVGKPRNHAVAGYVSRTEGAIGYVELHHALTNNLSYGAVQNKDKTAFIHCKPDNVTAAAKNLPADASEERSFYLTNMPGKDSYPICAIDFAVCYQGQPAAKQKMVVDFLQWVTHDGQKYTAAVHYAPLPEQLVAKADEKIKSIKTAQ
jgi:phosphate transport system substrate-binding protein